MLVLFASAIGYCTYEPNIPFDRDTWRKGERLSTRGSSSDGVAPRILMAEGLVRKRALLGKRRAEIEDMLGPPSDVGYFRTYDLVYWLGLERGFMRIDSEWLVVRLDATGTATEARIVND